MAVFSASGLWIVGFEAVGMGLNAIPESIGL